MSWLRTVFLSGLAIVLPIALTVWVIHAIASGVENLLGPALQRLLPDVGYVPGMGLIAALLVIIAVGLLARAWIVRPIVGAGERLLARLPLVKTIYKPLRDMMGFFTRGQQRDLAHVVLVDWGDPPARMIGFVTREQLGELGAAGDGRIAVYLPLSYAIGGFTVLLPKERVQPVDIGVEDAMRFAITAGLGSRAAEPGQAERPG